VSWIRTTTAQHAFRVFGYRRRRRAPVRCGLFDEVTGGELPNTHAHDVGACAFDQVCGAGERFGVARAHVADVLREIARLNLGERLVVGALDVGDRCARNDERRYQHRHHEHRGQQSGSHRDNNNAQVMPLNLSCFCDVRSNCRGGPPWPPVG